ncbi:MULTISPECIES: hypothetical protein [unclassified Empedobacter]|uniref:hypothetical protein n=1 Tax=unclassified Empedobacter TaxID=2643773 RepID=UPI0025777F68|nr:MULTISPECIES: hypothetical protein [unclassified Empedobacter]MDM1138883.1 hypothetical protein [Empedobacter sp. R132-2]
MDVQEFAKDTKDDIKEIVLERLKNPLINFYLFFLVIYNWDIILYTSFSGSTIELKIDCIRQMYHNSDIWWIFNWRFVAALIYSIISLFLFQLLSLLIEIFYNKLIFRRYVIFCKLEQEKAIEYRNVINARTANKKIEDLERENKTLKDLIETKDLEYSKFVEDNLKKAKNDKLERDILSIILQEFTYNSISDINLADKILNFINSNNNFTKKQFYNGIKDLLDLYFINDLEYNQDKEFNNFKNKLAENTESLIKYLEIQDLIKINKSLYDSTGKIYYN